MSHTDHGMIADGSGGWRCEACDFRCPLLRDAIAHAVAHQYQVAPPKPLPERPWAVRR